MVDFKLKLKRKGDAADQKARDEAPAILPPAATPKALKPKGLLGKRAEPAKAGKDAKEPKLAKADGAAKDAPKPGPAAPDQDAKAILSTLKKQQKDRLEKQKAEARQIDEQAKQLGRQMRNDKRMREDAAKHAAYVRGVAKQLGFDPDRHVTEIPPIPEGCKQVEFHTIQEGRSFVRILFDTRVNRYIYEAIEPQLTKTELEISAFLRDTLVRTMEGRRGKNKNWEQHLIDAIERAIVEHSILVDEITRQRIQYYLVRDFLGYGAIDVMMRDPMIEDISCDGPGIPIYIFHRQYESIKSNVMFADDLALDSYVIRLAQRSGKHISIADPLLDATLPDTSRLQASLSKEVTTRGSSFTIRRFRSDPLTPSDLVRLGTLDARMAAFFWLVMQEHKSLIYAGGTASGKTTSLNAICQFIPPQKKIVSIEDTREINLMHENWIAGLTRSGFGGMIVNGKVSGTIDQYKLLEAALRQRPEFLLVGEVRGQEALTLFQAMATGHATYSTMHADSASSAVYRLENPPINVPRIMLQTLDVIAIQVQARIGHRFVRRIKEVVEIVGIDPDSGDLLTNTVFSWDNKTDTFHFTGKSRIFEKVMEKNNVSLKELEAEWLQRAHVIEWMVRKGIRQIRDVASLLNAYYSDPTSVMATIAESEAADAAAAASKEVVEIQLAPPAEPQPPAEELVAAAVAEGDEGLFEPGNPEVV
ncbi:MAG TPA: type II/IV secretion system ATPase subunit [Candidatus Thermoplasmatota archaeon]|nr:type II/IV secretion system ATPase subunit [Candidatus Thermoplasmatota archaeon]